VDYKNGRLNEDLKAALPEGIDCYFENVGGEILDAVLRRVNPFSRIAVCGLISQYNATDPYGVKTFQSILTNRIKVQGFIVSDRMELWPKALAELAGWVAAGKIKYRESVAHGIENAPKALISLLKGGNFGKQLVKLV
jgi:NADPH-dependent curcumin reductase CurA